MSLFPCGVLSFVAMLPAAYAVSTAGLVLGAAGSITSDPAEVVSGSRSIKGSYFGSNPSQSFLTSDFYKLRLQRGQSYRITFRYKILSANQGFDFQFYSPTAATRGGPVPGQALDGSAGATGSFSFTGTLGSYDDYSVSWTIRGAGAIALDDVQITNSRSGEVVLTEDVEPGTALLSTFFVSASKPAFIWGEPVKVSASLYDESGKPVSIGPVIWTVEPSFAASVASDGTVTPQALGTFTVRGTVGGQVGEVRMHALPKQIVVVPEKDTLTVGSTQKVRADVLDVNGRPIAGAIVGWRVNSSGVFEFSPSATIDSAGNLKGLRQARVRVVATIDYPQSIPGFDVASRGEALVDIQPPVTYKFERIYTGKASGAATSNLAPSAAPLTPTEKGGFMFAASLDGLGNALLEWDDGKITPLLTSGRVNPATGFPLADFANYARTPAGSVMVQESDAAGSGLVSLGPPGLITPAFSSGAAVFGAKSTSAFRVSRNSIASSGAMLVWVQYTDAVTDQTTVGLFRGSGRGVSELLFNDIDGRVPRFSGVDNWGIANDGTAWFQVALNSAGLWRARPGEPARRILAPGDALGNETVRGFDGALTSPPVSMFVAENGDLVNMISTEKGQHYVLWHGDEMTPAAILAANVFGLHWYDPNVGALIDASFPGKPRGLYLWKQDTPRLLMMLNDTTLDGSPLQEILSATTTSNGIVYAMVRTANSLMTIARISPDPQVLLKAGDAVPVNVPPVITALIQGQRSGIPMVIAGGQAGSIARLDANGVVTPIVAVGARLPDGKSFVGSRPYEVRTISDDRVVFSHDLPATETGLFTWNQGTITVTASAPFTLPDGTRIGWPKNIEVNRRGDIAFYTSWVRNAVYRIQDGRLALVVEPNPTINGTLVQGLTVKGIDDSGNVLFTGTRPDGSGFYLGVADGTSPRLIMATGQFMPDGRQVTAPYFNFAAACADGFVAGLSLTPGIGIPMRYRNGTWGYPVDPAQPLATGAPATQVRAIDVNRGCEYVFWDGSGPISGIGAFAGSKYHQLQDLERFTPDGDFLSVSQSVINDDGTVYVLGANDQGQQVLYRGTPLR